MRAGAVVAAACVAAAGVVLSGCGVRSQGGPERLPAEVLPSELRPAAASSASFPTSTSTTVPVHLVEDGPPVREVDLLVEDRSIELPVEQGEVSSGPAERTDSWSVRPAG